MMLRELFNYPGFHFADFLMVTIGNDIFKSSAKALHAFYGHYTVVEFHVQSGSTTIDSIVICK